MIIRQTFTVSAPRERVAVLLTDVPSMSRCVPGVEKVREEEDNRYGAVLRLSLGPISTAFEGSVELDAAEAPQRLRASGRGRDRRSGSQAEISFTADLEEEQSDRTRVEAEADVVIRGRLGQFGTGVIESTGRELVASFAECLNATLAGAEGEAATPTVRTPSPFALAGRGVRAWAAERIRGLLRRILRWVWQEEAPASDAAASARLEESARETQPSTAAEPAGEPSSGRPELRFVEPESVEEAIAALTESEGRAKPLSGGTAVVLMMQAGLIDPQVLVSLRGIEELHGVKQQDGTIRIGAGTSLTDVAASPLVREHLSSLATACGMVGNVRIRNVASLGGNLAEADYASDPPSVLASLGATCTLRSANGERTVPVAELITGFYSTVIRPDELIMNICVPIVGTGRRVTYLKFRSRSSEDRPCVGVAARLDTSAGDGRDNETVRDLDIVVGAVAPVLQRLPDLTNAVVGSTLDDETIRGLSEGYAAGVEPMDDARGSAWYRRRMVEVLVRRALLELRHTQEERA